MLVTEKDKSKFNSLLRLALEQENLIEEITLTTQEGFKTNRSEVTDNPSWPEAVNPVLIIDRNSESDKITRAKAICNFFLSGCNNKKVLDFGCGDGHVSKEVARREASVSVGYDIKKQWEDTSDCILTTEISKVEENAPYDLILVFDVLDHLVNDDPVEVLKKLKGWCKGDIIIRFHPWCSRHATHTYYNLNKAYIHMFLSEDELKERGVEYLPSAKVIHPIGTYKHWLASAGLNVVSEDVIRDPVEPFFQQFSDIIKSHWKNSPTPDYANGKIYPSFQMEQQFLDYVVRG